MNEFKRLPWPVADVGTDLANAYALDMQNYQKRNQRDVFFSNLMDIDPTNLQDKCQTSNAAEVKIESNEFADPRTGIEIPTHVCYYRTVDWKKNNIFLSTKIASSKLRKHEHLACLNAVRNLTKPESELSAKDMNDRALYESTTATRSEEKCEVLEKLKAHYFANKSAYRFHEVPPAVDCFITEKWKRQLVVMHRQLASTKYKLRTAISLLPSPCAVNTELVHQTHLGNVPEMTNKNIRFIRQSSANLHTAYNLRKTTHMASVIKEKVNELIQEHAVDFVIPISVLKRVLGSEKDWSFCVTVRESHSSTDFNPKKEILFEKPLPPTYLSGYERYRKGAKYLLHSCLHRNTQNVFSHYDRIEKETGINTQSIDCESTTDAVEYKVINCDEFYKNYSKAEFSYGNVTLSIFDVAGHDDADDLTETFKILVPSKQPAYKSVDEGVRFVNYSPKIEFQSEYGGEEMRKDELISEWCELFFRPNTTTERVRFDCSSGTIINRQTITATDVEKDLKTIYKTDVQHLLQKIWHAFQTFSAFPTGDYLLQNDPKQLDCIRVYEKTDDSTESLRISQIIRNVSFDKNVFDEKVWQPIDDRIVTQVHEKYCILPCAFPHPEYYTENQIKEPQYQYKKIKAGRKKVKKLGKICPKNDSINIVKKKLLKNKEYNMKFEVIRKKNKMRKKMENRSRAKVRKNAAKAEVNELQLEKQLLASTMDQYSPQSGHVNTSIQNSANSSVASRRKGKKSPDKSIQQNVRRSTRVSNVKQF